jgi:ABC-type antimicrobial peptide transport system permease subunit
MQVVVRTRAAPEGLIGPVRAAIWAQDRDLALGAVRTLDEVVSRATSRFRFPMQLIAIFAVMALVVSLSGIYGVISQLVTGSMRDIGIRIALGATPRRILAFVLRSGMVLTVIGVLVGLAVAVGLTRLAAHLLFGISAGQVSIYLGVGIAVTTAAAIACLLPARRAAALDPNRAIRDGQ